MTPIFAGLLVCLGGCGSSGTVYPVTHEEAHRLLAQSDVPRFIFGSAKIDVRVLDQGTSRIVWQVNEAGDEQLHFTATLIPEGDKSTRVTVAVAGPDLGPHATNRARLESSPSIAHLYTTAMAEQVAATIEHRGFNITKVYPALTVAEVANLPGLAGQMEQEGKSYQRWERNNMEKAYGDNPAGH